MPETTVAIKKIWDPYKAGDKKTNLEDADGNKYRVDVDYAAKFHAGDVVVLSWSEETASAAYGGKSYRALNKITYAPGGVREISHLPSSPPKPVDGGPHLGMWEKEAMDALRSGMTSSEVILMGIEARQAAREILRTDLDGKLSEPTRGDSY